jgi:DNA-binding NarL/FixJ family response regulator
MSDIRVLIADDHPVVRGGLKSFLAACGGIEVVGEAADGAEALARAIATRPDVVLMDLEMPQLDGLEATQALRRQLPGAKVLVLSGYSDAPRVCGVMEAGVEGYLTKDVAPDALAEAIRAVSRCEPAFCPSVMRQLARQTAREARPRGTVTIAFTDIENSTQLVEQRGDFEARAIFRKHDALVRDVVAAHRGCVVEHPGDAFMLAFSSAVGAVQCAVALQRAQAQAARAQPQSALRVRIGLHTGEVLCEGEGYFGRTVFVAARVAERARGGEILVSEVTRSLVAGGTLRLAAHGRHRLKGLRTPYQLHRVCWDDAAPADAAAAG